MSQPLDKQVAVISGGLGDIGRAIALELARRGAHIAVSDIHEASAARGLADQLRDLGIRHRYDQVDVADSDQVNAWIDGVERDLGVPMLVVPNAATVTLAGVKDVTPEQWRKELSINLDGAFHMAQAAARRMLHHKRAGRIVFIGSWAAHAAHPNIPAYCVAKAGLRMLCKCMALELAPHDILVNEVAPGYVDAGLSAQVWVRKPGAREKAAARVPTGKLIDSAEVAKQVAYLCDPENRHMTGGVLLMDGGLSLVTAWNR